jgi:hypothetical protein
MPEMVERICIRIFLQSLRVDGGVAPEVTDVPEFQARNFENVTA